MTSLLYASLVLKLNGSWQPMEHISVKEALKSLFKEDGDALRALDLKLEADGSISNESQSYTGTEWIKLPVRPTDNWIGLVKGERVRVPLVVLTPHFHTLPKVRLSFNRMGLYTRERGICSYCSVQIAYDDATNDHVIPITQGGETTWENCTLACGPCNLKKGGRTPEQAGMPLRKIPKTPGLCPMRPELRRDSPAEHRALLAA